MGKIPSKLQKARKQMPNNKKMLSLLCEFYQALAAAEADRECESWWEAREATLAVFGLLGELYDVGYSGWLIGLCNTQMKFYNNIIIRPTCL